MRVLTLGTFDLFHVGHANLLRRCAAYGNEVYVGVNTDRFVIDYKGVRPTINEEDRLLLVRACRWVTAASFNDGPGRELIEQIAPGCIAVGSDWHQADYLKQIDVTQEHLDENGIALLYLPRTPGVSSTDIRRGL